ncbi:RDD family protein [uncultured Dokdonia sp.]|uniref:RDD family protein n=1 Tax=uncultured Dokdonia sp. TaxID=575653 RepID=UPI002637AB18|nr:RDD family protein [uncultured Dokdonia sp.]
MQNNVIEYSFENTFQIAQKRTRIIAFIIDLFIYAIIGITLGYFLGEPINEIGFMLKGGTPIYVMMLLGFFLWPISEGIWGQTIGKRILNIKVLTNHYQSIDITASLTRYILGFIDYVLLIGFIVAANNKMNKRIGDIAANTIVVQM